jgi:hypothetical protein
MPSEEQIFALMKSSHKHMAQEFEPCSLKSGLVAGAGCEWTKIERDGEKLERHWAVVS